MLIGASSTGLEWLIALVPTVSLLVAFITAWAATYPQRKDRREREEGRKEREDRLDATADVVLGRDPDPNRGQIDRVPGLAEQVNAHTRQLTEMNRRLGQTKDNRPLAQILEEALMQLARIGMAQQDADELAEAQQETIRRNGQQVEGHERRLGRADERLNLHETELRELWRQTGGRPTEKKQQPGTTG